MKLAGYSWPGNLGELLGVVERAAILSGEAEIKPEDFSIHSTVPSGPLPEDEAVDLKQILENIKAQYIHKAYARPPKAFR